MDSKGEVAVEEEQKETCLTFLYNSQKGTFLGRTGISWLKIGVFYAIFYCCLAGWFAGLLHAFYSTLDEVSPTYNGTVSQLQGNPGVAVRPMPIFDSTLIRFSQGRPSSYRAYTDHLTAFFRYYEPSPDGINCDKMNRSDTEICNVNITTLLDELEVGSDYGYDAGTPVIVIKMNKIFGFEPEGFNSEEEITGILKEDEVLNFEKLAFSPGNVGVSCDGQNAVDRQHILELDFAPKDGMSPKYFPYLNQKGYRAPVVLVKLTKLEQRVTIQMVCKVWAWNIDNTDGKQMRGSVHFEVYID
ncbi:sodium/potassium-transporting ATPase subunit beta-like [Watersipora subatra]|uniref:sodium/potassium-transporting ATPase subunit beta-like n=1 Tax=Watersipora subatra TaxID=2589382 RepID=UPI00355C574D